MAEKKKPLLWDTELVDDTIADLDTISANDYARAAEDPNWIPGYSEHVRANALAKAEYGSMAYQQRRYQMQQLGVGELKPLPIEITTVRIATLDGKTNDNISLDMARYRADGYQFVTPAVLERYGMRMPPLYSIAADGTIRRGDSALMYVDAQRAKLNDEIKLAETRARESTSSTVGQSTGVHIDVEVERDDNFTL